MSGDRGGDPVLEIACDESGYEGENLIGATTEVFAHASVRLSRQAAASCIQETRDRIRSPAREYKSNHLLRAKHRSVLEWLLGPSGPIHGNAHVHLIDKPFLVVRSVIDLLVEDAADAMAVTLQREGRGAFGDRRWEAFLKSFNDLLRARTRPGSEPSVDPFFRMVDVLALADPPGGVGDVLGRLRRARPRVEALRARLLDDPGMLPPLDPLLPAIVAAVVWWGDGGTPVSIVHDQHTALTDERIQALKRRAPSGRLTSLRLVDSRADARVQVADFLAGVARKIATDELDGRGDPELTALLRPYVDACSIWGDERSWSLLHDPAMRPLVRPPARRGR